MKMSNELLGASLGENLYEASGIYLKHAARVYRIERWLLFGYQRDVWSMYGPRMRLPA
jgi:hypothetical protein